MPMKYFIKILCIVFPALLTVSCIVPYEPEELLNLDDIIVVEGNISLTGPFTIQITRSAPISSYQYGQKTIKFERNANVYVTDKQGRKYMPETNTAKGEYLFDFSALHPDHQEEYKLVVESMDGHTYETDFKKSSHSSSMELHYKVDTLEDKVRIFVSSHDQNGLSKYYNWQYIETWDYVSQLPSYCYFDVLEVKETKNNKPWMYRCWNSRESSDIILLETSSLSEDRITDYELHSINFRDIRITQHYTIEVVQTVLDSEAYKYMENMRKNSYDIGNLFSPQPNEISGNIRCVTDQSVRAIGFVTVCNSVRKRLLIDCVGLPGYPREAMPQDTLVPLDAKVSTMLSLIQEGYSPYMIDPMANVSYWNLTRCIDCRSKGGQPEVPFFWPVEWPRF